MERRDVLRNKSHVIRLFALNQFNGLKDSIQELIVSEVDIEHALVKKHCVFRKVEKRIKSSIEMLTYFAYFIECQQGVASHSTVSTVFADIE